MDMVFNNADNFKYEKENRVFKKSGIFSSGEFHCTQDDNVLTFFPLVSIQRYFAVRDTLSDKQLTGYVKKVVDFGCSSMKFFRYLRRMEFIEHIVEVDIDREILDQHVKYLAPLTADYIGFKDFQLVVEVFVGSISDQDVRLTQSDAVICIELIEHLQPDVLEKVPVTIFGFMKPNVAIFTTPNAEFNVLFNTEGFRHADHKFEWTRKQFRQWSNDIISRYPCYDVYFVDVGPGPAGTEHLGCCTQMAVFYLTDLIDSLRLNKRTDNVPDETMMPYTLLKRYEYPFFEDNRTVDEKFQHKLAYWINSYCNSTLYSHEDDDFAHIPLEILLPHVEQWCPTMECLREKLMTTKWSDVTLKGEEYTLSVNKYSQSEEEYEDEDMYQFDELSV